ncbi:DUF2290 domain-containing protein [Pantoea ananatis]|uniref:DUF2290 domain-containing protein n=1 Tax=Pantoea ananas TaxID=553 RepID=UPI001B310506|nr:DUF2290 domain-containing protein [Pantoea ananatis]
MIPIATFNTSSKSSVDLVRDIGLLANYNNNIIYPDFMPAELRPLSYEDAWKKCTYDGWFNIQLEDGSLIIFKQGSYTYLMTPVKTLSYEDYLAHYYPEDEWQQEEETKLVISQEYDNYIDTHTKNFPPMPVRFDIDHKHYCEHSHPYCHFHFGIENEGRVATKKLLTPLSFTAFILRTFYPKPWKVFSQSEALEAHIRFFSQGLSTPPADLWKPNENNFLYIG